MRTQPQDEPRRSTEYFGQGQSGYTAGRVEDDHSLQLEARNATYPRGGGEHVLELGVDERFTGVGGVPWGPEAAREREGA